MILDSPKTTEAAADKTGDIRRSLDLLHEPGDVFEIRVLGVPGGKGFTSTASGYFDDIGKAATLTTMWDARKAKGIYVTVNPCMPALLARAHNRIIDRAKTTTSDAEILRRRWMFFDIDPQRPSGIAATTSEMELAASLAGDVEDKLRARGWPFPLVIESGNGAYLLYRIDLPNDPESLDLISKCYAAVNGLLGGIDPSKPYAEIDRTVGNAARIIRIGGTTNRKGDPTPDRPHRVCTYHPIDPEQPVEAVPVEKIRELAALAKPTSKQKKSNNPAGANGSANGARGYSRLMVPEYLKAHGITPTVKESPGGTIYKVGCPFDDSHGGNGESAIVQRDDGLLTYECKHNSCQGRQWRDYREAVGRPAATHWDPPLGTKPANTNGDGGDSEQPPTFATSLLSSVDFNRQKYKLDYIIDGVLVFGQQCVTGGRSKVLKTSVMIDMVVSMGSGTPFLGYFPTKKCRVGFWSGESGAATIQAKARRATESRGVALSDCDVFWSFDLPRLGKITHVDAMAEIVQAWGLDVIVVDPLYLSLLDGSEMGSPGDLFFMGSKLLPLSELGQRTGVTIILVHHFRKGSRGASDDEQTALEELSMSGCAEWARQWVLLARREPFQHDGQHSLWMRCGGSAGHAGLYGVDIDEGMIDEHFGGRKWEVEVQQGHEVIRTGRSEKTQARADQQREKNEADQRTVIEAMSTKLPRGEGAFPRKLRSMTGILSHDRLDRILLQLVEQTILEPCEALQAPSHKTPKAGAFRLTEDWWNDD